MQIKCKFKSTGIIFFEMGIVRIPKFCSGSGMKVVFIKIMQIDANLS